MDDVVTTRVPPPGTSAYVLGLLASYPHVAACPGCLSYAATNLDDLPPRTVLVATFARHDSGHSSDPLTLATQHFA